MFWTISSVRLKGERLKAMPLQLILQVGSVMFFPHVFEHIPHTKIPLVLSEINRVLKPGGVLRLLIPDFRKIAKAYINNDEDFFRQAKEEDPSLWKAMKN